MINVIKDKEVTVTESELARYKAEYERTYMYYSGTPPTLNEFIARKQSNETKGE